MKVNDKVCCISCTCANIHQSLGVNENFSEKNRYGSNSSSTYTTSVIWFCFHNDLLSELIECWDVRTGGRVVFVSDITKGNRKIVLNMD